MRGAFITFEGGDGAGKSSQAARLFSRLNRCGVRTILTREPGGTRFAEAIRSILLDPGLGNRSWLAELLAFYAARADHVNAVIRPAIEDGTWVICDRFIDSTRAYQGWMDPMKRVVFDRLESLVVSKFLPNLTFMLDVDPQVGIRRAVRRMYGTFNSQSRLSVPEQLAFSFAPDRFEALDVDFHRTVRETFLAISAAEPERCVVIDADDTFTAIADKIWDEVVRRYGADEEGLLKRRA